MQKIRLDGLDVIAEVEWTALPSDLSEKKALSEYMSKNKARRGIIIRNRGITVVGKADKKSGSTPSAAALLALASQKAMEDHGVASSDETNEDHNWIVVEQLDGNEEIFWMGAVKNGVPVPGSDIVGNRTQVIDEAVSLTSTSASFTVFTVDRDVRYNVLSQAGNVVEKRFAEIVRPISPKKAQLNLFSIAAILAVAVVLITMALVGGWMAYSKWDEKQKAESARKAAAAQKKAQASQDAADEKKYEEEVRHVVLAGLDQGMTDVEKSLQAASPQEAVLAWRNVIYNVDLDQASWVLQGISCILEDSLPKCTVSLVRGPVGVNKLLLERFPDAQIEGDSASYILDGHTLTQRPVNIQILGSSSDFSKTVLSDLQMLRSVEIAHTVSQSKEVTKEVKIPAKATVIEKAKKTAGEATPVKPINIQLGFGSGNVAITGRYLWQLAGVSRMLDSTSVRAKDLTIALAQDGTATWSLNVEYLVRTLPQPVIPPVKVGEQVIKVPLPQKYVSAVPVEGEGVTESTVSATNPSAPSEDPTAANANQPPPE